MNARATNTVAHVLLLREVLEEDLPIFFEQQLNPAANHMAAFTAKDSADRAAFFAKWSRILTDATILKKTVVVNGDVAGHVLSFEQDARTEVSYWLGTPFWGKGIATHALRKFLDFQTGRPLYARAAKDHMASLRVLEKCGFEVCGQDKGFSNARGRDVEEYVLILNASHV